MKFTVVVPMLLAVSIAPAAFGACQQAAAGGNLAQQLQAAYVPTVLESNGLKVAQPGCVLVVQQEGVAAYPAFSKLASADNIYEDGKVRSGTRSKIFGGLTPSRPLAPGEKVYLLRTEIKENGLVFQVQTCGACEPAAADPTHKPYRATIDVRFQKGFLTVTDLNHIEQAVGEILAFPDAVSTTAAAASGLPPAPPQPATFAAIAPPPPPQEAAPPASISSGQTPDQVKTAFGEPATKAKAGAKKEIWVYKNLKVTFVDGKVTDVE